MINDVVDLVGQLRSLVLKLEIVNDYNINIDKALEELEQFHKAHDSEEIRKAIWNNFKLAINSIDIKFESQKIELKIEKLISEKYTRLIERINLDELEDLPVRLCELEKNMSQNIINTNKIFKDASTNMHINNTNLATLAQDFEENYNRLLAANKTIKSYKVWHLISVSISFFLLGFLSSQYFQNNPIILTVEKEVEVPTHVNKYVTLHETEDGLYIISNTKLKRKDIYLSDTKHGVIKVK